MKKSKHAFRSLVKFAIPDSLQRCFRYEWFVYCYRNPALPNHRQRSLPGAIHPLLVVCNKWSFNTLTQRQNGRRLLETFSNMLNENILISFKVSLKYVPKDPINDIAALGQMRASRRPGDKPLSEPIMVSLLTQICGTLPQWVNSLCQWSLSYTLVWWSWFIDWFM